MKDILINNYDTYDTHIKESDSYCFFVFNNKKYYFVPLNRTKEEFNEILQVNNELITKNIPTAKFVPNKYNEFLSTYEEKSYCLLEYNLDSETEVNILDMVNYDKYLKVYNSKSILYRNNWASLWSEKMDYFEYQVSELGMDKEIILNSFSYYEGLCENAIAYVNSTIKKFKIGPENIVLQRKRINYPNNIVNYFNPLNYCLDIEVRDVASYFKTLFFNDYDSLFIEIKAYLKTRRLSIYGYSLLYARLLYPSYYFDVYEKVIENKESEEKLIPIINKASDYEKFLKDMYYLLSCYAPIEKVPWLLED